MLLREMLLNSETDIVLCLNRTQVISELNGKDVNEVMNAGNQGMVENLKLESLNRCSVLNPSRSGAERLHEC